MLQEPIIHLQLDARDLLRNARDLLLNISLELFERLF